MLFCSRQIRRTLKPSGATRIALVLWLATVIAPRHPACAQEDAPPGEPIRVMSVNIRNGLAKDGPNHWDLRRELLVEMLRSQDADLIGTQETYPFQADYLREQLPDYEYLGRSRDNADGEQCGVFWRRQRFQLLDSGHFWLSETPDLPGSRSWDAALPRMATWVKLRDRTQTRSFIWLNTHFDHRGETARHESAKLMRRYVEQFAATNPVIVTGDFNAAEQSPPYVALMIDQAAVESGGVTLQDTFRTVHSKRGEDEGTFNGFQGWTRGARIDWILATPAFHVRDAQIIRFERQGRFPSDHFPVTAELQWLTEPESGD